MHQSELHESQVTVLALNCPFRDELMEHPIYPNVHLANVPVEENDK